MQENHRILNCCQMDFSLDISVNISSYMGWLNKFFKGSRFKFSERQCHCESEEDENQCSTDYEIESTNQAIALSFLEEKEKTETIDHPGSHLEEEEELASTLQDSLRVESPPYGNEHIYQSIPFLSSSGFRLCAGCNTEIAHGHFINCMGAVWHLECFCCHACNQPISDYEFSISGNYPYHKSCNKEHHHPKCDVCKQFIPTNMAGLIEYRVHPFWKQKYCPSHELDGTPRCCSCERMETRYTRYVSLDDGRKLCPECLDSAIMGTSECQPLFLDIQKFYEGLNMNLTQQIPLLLVERQALNEAVEGKKNGHHHLPETRGLCLSEEQTVSTVRISSLLLQKILRRPKISTGSRVTKLIIEPYRLSRVSDVTAILILYGLPRLLTGSILAHEMMHAWLRLNGYRTISREVEEGICQVLAHMWLESEIMSGPGSNAASSSSSSASTSTTKGRRSHFERQLGAFFKHQIESDTSLEYGNGFRAGNQAVLHHGLRHTLDHISLTGSFPC